MRKKISPISRVGIALVAIAIPAATWAFHTWGNYHWARDSNPFNLDLGDNVDSGWDSHLRTAAVDWSLSSVLDTTVTTGQAGNPKRCSATSGRVEVCNASYGNNGWLGIAQIWASGDHITQAIVKVNDFYYDLPTYDTPAWRQSVMCQEIGHTIGLGHNDEDFNTTNGTCMDYSNDPEPNQHPDDHDYATLVDIYPSHVDGGSGGSGCNPRSPKCQARLPAPPPAMNQIDLDGPGQWGRLVGASASGRTSTYELDFGNGWKIVTHVTWALESDR